VLEDRLAKEDIQEEYKRRLRGHIKEWIVPALRRVPGKGTADVYLDAYGEYGQTCSTAT